MKKLITGAIVAAALAVPATPAFAIHDGTDMPGAHCSNPDSRAVGNNPNPGSPNVAFANTILNTHNKFARTNTSPPCRFGNLNFN
jgi:hypothetical protein